MLVPRIFSRNRLPKKYDKLQVVPKSGIKAVCIINPLPDSWIVQDRGAIDESGSRNSTTLGVSKHLFVMFYTLLIDRKIIEVMNLFMVAGAE